MRCPHCNYEMEEKQRSCLHCGFVTNASFFEGVSVGESGIRQGGEMQRERVGSAQVASRYFQPGEQKGRRTQQSALHATRFVIDPVPREGQQDEVKAQPLSSNEVALPSPPSPAMPEPEEVSFAVGSLLGGERYSLIERLTSQRWSDEVYETYWKAKDLFLGGQNVVICELGLPKMRVVNRQVHLRAAMKEFFKVGMHPQLPTLTNVFREKGRDLFVFNSISGETLLARMQRTGRPLQEQEVITGCLQITEALEAIPGQGVKLLHGLISPEHLLITRSGQWFLVNFSMVLASGARQYLADLDPSLFSSLIAPEFTKGEIDSRSDLYALLATAYFAVTGEPFKGAGEASNRSRPLIPQLSPSLEAIFKRGLHPNASQRYQQVSTLRRDLLALLTSSSNTVSSVPQQIQENNGYLRQEQRSKPPMSQMGQEQRSKPPMSQMGQEQRSKPPMSQMGQEQRSIPLPQFSSERQPFGPEMQVVADPVAQVLSSLASLHGIEGMEENLLPRPDELLPIHQGNEMLVASLWMGGILICLLIPVFVK